MRTNPALLASDIVGRSEDLFQDPQPLLVVAREQLSKQSFAAGLAI
jgi:hypothetical protein